MARRESGRRRADSLECEAAEAFQQSCEPQREEIPPTKRTSVNPRKGLSNCQWEIHHGTNPATNPGATSRKTAEPTSADTFRTTL